MQFFSPSTLIIGTMPIWGTTDSLMHNSWGEVNRSRYTHYDLGVSLHNAYGLNIPTKVDVIQYLDRERWVQCFSCKRANVKSVLDQMNQNLHSIVFCVLNNFCVNIFCGKIICKINA